MFRYDTHGDMGPVSTESGTIQLYHRGGGFLSLVSNMQQQLQCAGIYRRCRNLLSVLLIYNSFRSGGRGKHMRRLRICKALNMLQWTKVSISLLIESFYTHSH